MPQSLAQIYVHLFYSTKHRVRVLANPIRQDLHHYMGGILTHHECAPVEINSAEDHVHLLLRLSRTHSISTVVGRLKKVSTEWIRERDHRFSGFHWQSGYGAFSVSQSSVERVREYIQNQEEHHRQVSFQDEFRALLQRHRVAFDERWVWD